VSGLLGYFDAGGRQSCVEIKQQQQQQQEPFEDGKTM